MAAAFLAAGFLAGSSSAASFASSAGAVSVTSSTAASGAASAAGSTTASTSAAFFDFFLGAGASATGPSVICSFKADNTSKSPNVLFSTFEFTSFIIRLPPPPVPAGRGLRSFGSVGTGASSYVRVWLTVIRLAFRLNSRTTKSAVPSAAIEVPSACTRCFAWHEPSKPYGKETND